LKISQNAKGQILAVGIANQLG